MPIAAGGSTLPTLAGAAALAGQARQQPFQQNLAGANVGAGTIQGVNGGTQQLGAAAMRRLGPAPPPVNVGGAAPAPPTGSFANGTGDRMPGVNMGPGDIQALIAGQNQPGSAAGGSHGGPQSIATPGMAQEPYNLPGGQSGSATAGGTSIGGTPQTGQAGTGGGSTFNLPGFKPATASAYAGAAGQAAAQMQMLHAQQGGGSAGTQPATPDPNAARQALGSGAMMNNIAKAPIPATSPFGQAPGGGNPAVSPGAISDVLRQAPGGGPGVGIANMPDGPSGPPRAMPSSPGGGVGFNPGGGGIWAGGGGGLRGFKPRVQKPVGTGAYPGPNGTQAGPSPQVRGVQLRKPPTDPMGQPGTNMQDF
jgi:translation initiation factor IF-2